MVTYLEWNRSLPHGWFLRVFWLFADGIAIFNLVQQGRYLSENPNADTGIAGPLFIRYAVSVVCTSILAGFGLIGLIPPIRRILEANFELAFRKPETKAAEESVDMSATKLFWRHSVTRYSVAWLIMGTLISFARGYLLQQVYKYFGNVFAATSETSGHCGGPPTDNTGAIVTSIMWMVLVFTIYAVCFGLSQYFWAVAAEIIVNGPHGVRNKLFKNMLAQDANYIHGISTGTLVSRFANDADRMKRTIAEFMPQVMEFSAMVVTGMIFLFVTAWSITVYMITIVPLTYAVTYYQAELFELYETRNMARIAGITAKVQDVFSKFSTVLIYGKQNTERRSLGQLVRLSYRIMRRKAGFAGILVTVTEFLSWSTTVLGTFLGSSLIIGVAAVGSNSNPLGVFVTYCLFSINVIRGLVMLLRTLPKIGETFGACSEILTMIEREPQLPEATPRSLALLNDIKITHGEIVFKDVVFSYPTAGEEPAKIALDGINLTIKPNTKVAIVGDSGAGKSTILHLIARFYDVTKGSVNVDGQDIRQFSTDSLRREMAIVSQDSDIFAMTILENILYGRHIDEPDDGAQLVADTLQALKDGTPLPAKAQRLLDEAMKAVDGANAGDFVRGQETKELGQDGKGLSGGQRQRLTISRALFKNPRILLLDEVTSALDAISEGVVQAAIDRLTSNRTVLIVAHRLHTIKNSDLILVMQKGRIVAQGKHDELMLISERYRELVEAAEHGEKKDKAVPKEEEPDELSAEIKVLFKNIRRALREYPALRKKYLKQMVKLYPQLRQAKKHAVVVPKVSISPSSSEANSDSEDGQGGVRLTRVRPTRHGDDSSSDQGSDAESIVSYESDTDQQPKGSLQQYYALQSDDDDGLTPFAPRRTNN